MKNLNMLSLLFLLSMILLCPKKLQAANGQIMFVAKLNTSNEIPLVRGDALGLVTFLLSEDRKEVMVHGVFTNLTGGVVGCHIHHGKKDENGPVLVNLTSFVSGVRIKGAFTISSEFLELAISGQLYINVHTASHPNGEIRGQLDMMAEMVVPIVASGLHEVPPDTNSAIALGSMRFSQNFTRMQYQIKPIGLSGPVISAHIHLGTEGINGPVIATLNSGDFISGTIEDSMLVKNIFQEILLENAYVNIHTTAKPNGEIRSQLLFDAFHNGSTILNGDQEIPPVTTSATGYGYAALDQDLDSISYFVIYSDLIPISAHIHHAAAGLEGPVIAALETQVPGIYKGKSALTEDNLTAFFKDELYFNIHSNANPGGEIRGQIENNIMNSFAFDLCGDQEIPVKNIPGYGAAYLVINKANTEIEYGIITNALNGDATTTRLYDGAFGSIGTTMLNLELPNPYTIQVTPILGIIASKIDGDRGYINIHTAANPSGELRGQVRRILSCKINTSTREPEVQYISILQNHREQTVLLKSIFDRTIHADVYITDLNGKTWQQWKTSFPACTSVISYNLQSLMDGFYVLNIREENKTLGVFKLVK